MRIFTFDEIENKEWDALVYTSPDGWAWGLSAWRKTILGVGRWVLEDYSFGVHDGSRLVAVMPLQYVPAQNVMASTGWGYCGPMVAANIAERHRKKILTTLFEHTEHLAQQCHAVEVKFGVPPMVDRCLHAPWGVNPYIHYGYEDISGLSRVVFLGEQEDILWHNCSELAKRMIKKARSKGYYVKAVSWQEYLNIYYTIHQETYNRTGVLPHPKSYFQGIAENMASSGHALLWCCFDIADRAVAFHNTSVFADKAYYHTGCSMAEHLDEGVNYLLFFEVLRGMKQRNVLWYECGPVFPLCKDSNDKRTGLTTFKTKFGGETHRYFLLRKRFSQPAPGGSILIGRKQLVKNFLSAGLQLCRGVSCFQRKNEVLVNLMNNRNIFSSSELYLPNKISLEIEKIFTEDIYSNILMRERLALVEKYIQPQGTLLDMGCSVGSILEYFAQRARHLIGVDLSERYIKVARERFSTLGVDASFVCMDLCKLDELKSDEGIDCAYSFSTLYLIDNFKEISSCLYDVLNTNGIAILDLGNSRSLNAYCCSFYAREDGFVQLNNLTIEDQLHMLRATGFTILEHRCFQLLPLWAGKPHWLYPLLHPVWGKILKKKVKGRMLDEWISSLPFVRKLSFRHLIVCKK